jgi:spore coat polysaccharide biosynthesis protein SpsF
VKLIAVIQARISSRRLPGKVLRPLHGHPLLGYVIDVVKKCQGVDGMIVATSDDRSDDVVDAFAKTKDLLVYRGSLTNVAQRLLFAMKSMRGDALVRISGDSPFIDHRVISNAVELYRGGKWDVVTNVQPRSFPPGCSVEIVSAPGMVRAVAEITSEHDMENVTPWFYRGDNAKVHNFKHHTDLSIVSLAVDTESDFLTAERILGEMKRPHTEYTIDETVAIRRRIKRP